MTQKKLNISEARRQLGRLVSGVSRRGLCVAITQHGREQAALIGMQAYRDLTQKAQSFERSQKKARPFKLKGSLELICSPEDLVKEMRRIRSLWLRSVEKSSEELVRELGRK